MLALPGLPNESRLRNDQWLPPFWPWFNSSKNPYVMLPVFPIPLNSTRAKMNLFVLSSRGGTGTAYSTKRQHYLHTCTMAILHELYMCLSQTSYSFILQSVSAWCCSYPPFGLFFAAQECLELGMLWHSLLFDEEGKASAWYVTTRSSWFFSARPFPGKCNYSRSLL